jgi:anthranilate synthase component 1
MQKGFEQIFSELKADLIGLDGNLANVLELESEPLVKLLQVFAYREMMLIQRENQKAVSVMLAFAKGSDLDQIGARYNVKRLLIDSGNPSAIPPVLPTYESDEDFKRMVTRGKQECQKGNVFQIVLSRRFYQQYKGDDFMLYRTLRSVNPSPYLFYFNFGDFRIFGSSPEAHLVVDVKKQKAYIKPIAGTFRRTGDDEKDFQLAEKLRNDKKENAEHVMLVDLARNDLSRNTDQVEVEVFREVQYYSHVLHLVSSVSGKMKPETKIIKLFADTFPAGTLSGAPKIKAMQLIDQIEPHDRGPYGGCLGYIGFDGSFNQAITIRSFVSKNNTLYYQAGAGVVAKSDEESELQEVNNKLAALKKAVISASPIQSPLNPPKGDLKS